MNSCTMGFYYNINKCDINYLKYIIEAYDNTAVLTTIDPNKGIVFLSVAHGCENLIKKVIEDLSKTISIKLINNFLPK